MGDSSRIEALVVEEAKDTRKLPPLRPLPKVGQELGHFIIERELPRGGQARVFRAWQTDLSRPVALKLLPSTVITDADTLTRFRREVENVAKLAHPNIVRVYEAGELEGHPFFTMEYLEGEDAEAKLRRSNFAPDEAASIMEVIARAVGEAHRKELVHRDIKPGNVFIKKDGTPVLTDFGLAQDLSQSAQLTQTGVSMGTPAYMSPEQARGERHRLGKRSDIYAMGATLYSMLTGRRPAEGESAYEIMMKVAESPGPRWTRGDIEVIPADLRAVVEMTMQNDPAKRYDTAQSLADDLERFMAGEWVIARSRSWVQKAFFRARRYAAVAAVIIIALALGGGIVWTSLDPPSRRSNTGDLLPERDIWKPVATATDDPKRLQDWVTAGAAMAFGPNRELVLTRTSEAPISLAHRDDLCWGDFELEANLSVRDAKGEVALLIGLPAEPAEGAPPRLNEPAYSIVLGAHAPQRFEIRRLGVPMYAGSAIAQPQLLMAGGWYRVKVTRAAENLRFELRSYPGELTVAVANFDDDFPALVEGRRRFAFSADAAALSIRDVAIRHRDSARGAEALLFSVGAYAEAEFRLAARLSAPVVEGEDPEARANWRLMRARCLQAMGKTQDALAELAELNKPTTSPRTLARSYMLSAQILAERGDDRTALFQMRQAVRYAGTSGDLASRAFHAALAHAATLAKGEDAARAIGYYDFVAGDMAPDAYLICAAVLEGSRLRLKLADDPKAADALELRTRALVALRGLRDGNYASFPDAYAGSLRTLFELRLPEVTLGRAALDDAKPAAPELIDAGMRLAALNGIDRKPLLPVFVHSSWLARMQGDLKTSDTMLAIAEPVADTEGKLWIRALRLLSQQERRAGGDAQARFTAWQTLNADIKELSRVGGANPRHDAVVLLATLFTSVGGPTEMEGHIEAFRRGMARALPEHDALWRGGTAVQAFIDYAVAVSTLDFDPDRKLVEPMLDKLSKRDDAGVLRLLKGRVKDWLPRTIG
ncbi:MAG: serine/threonine protein kinase [Planctomycetes bacterium]|nr:serine/threonine protein kinase [Planctomycetota bacterium]